MKRNQTFAVDSVEYAEWQADLKRLKFHRCIDAADYHEANIACAQMDYWKQEAASRAVNAALPLEHLEEYQAAAVYHARMGILPDCMGSPGAIDYINADPEAFEAEVRLVKYAISMGEKI